MEKGLEKEEGGARQIEIAVAPPKWRWAGRCRRDFSSEARGSAGFSQAPIGAMSARGGGQADSHLYVEHALRLDP